MACRTGSLWGMGHIHVQKDGIKPKAFKVSPKLVLSTAEVPFCNHFPYLEVHLLSLFVYYRKGQSITYK